jgi:hypothetical protein
MYDGEIEDVQFLEGDKLQSPFFSHGRVRAPIPIPTINSLFSLDIIIYFSSTLYAMAINSRR